MKKLMSLANMSKVAFVGEGISKLVSERGSLRVEAACASGSITVRSGWMAIQSGLADIVLVKNEL